MKIVRDLEQDSRHNLEKAFKDHHLFGSHIAPILNSPHLYEVELGVDDYRDIIVCSNIYGQPPPEYRPLVEVIDYIARTPSFLKTSAQWHGTRPSGRLSGVVVNKYLIRLRMHQTEIQAAFQEMGAVLILDKGRYEVQDGMHRLVAYGLATNLETCYFPIRAYVGTHKPRQPGQEL